MATIDISETEKTLIDTYNTIATSFDMTRVMIWKCVQKFLEETNTKSKILDMGCGNGKNMKFFIDNNRVNVYGCDACENFVSLCKSKSLNVSYGNILDIPYPNDMFDNVICIAVLHHLSTKQHRIAAINELLRVVKPGGKILITVASFEFPFYKNIKSTQDFSGQEQDFMIPWKDSSKKIMGTRYYHLFKQNELEELCANCTFKNIEGFFELDNWGCILTK